MRSAFYLFFFTGIFSMSQAWADGSTFPCGTKLVCSVPVTVNTSVSPCTATTPYRVTVNRRRDRLPIVIRLYIDPPNSPAKFEQVDGVTFVGNGNHGTPWSDHFDRPIRFSDRVFWIVDKNPSGDEQFEYAFAIRNVDPCRSGDPFIHNTN
jgi:hypothetical protein